MEDNTEKDFQKLAWGMELIDLAEATDRSRDLVKAVMDIHVPKNAGNFLTS